MDVQVLYCKCYEMHFGAVLQDNEITLLITRTDFCVPKHRILTNQKFSFRLLRGNPNVTYVITNE